MLYKLFLLLICLNVFMSAYGCGQLPTGQERAINFTLTDFKLPAVMVYSEKVADKSKVPTISANRNEAEGFVQRLVMGAVEDVLYQQGCSAFLSDNVIATILQQLDIQISYEALKCENVITQPLIDPNGFVADMRNCIIVEGIVTSTCTEAGDGCKHDMIAPNLKAIEPKYLAISGSLKTSNAIMANWSTQMWESVLNRVLRNISSNPNGSFFFGASIKLN